jgi:homoserine kinase
VIAAYAPATVSNVACGFDVLGFALDEPGDIVTAAAGDMAGVRIAAIHGDGGRLSTDANRNTAGAAVRALLDRLDTPRGIVLEIYKGLPLGSGVGSSGASAAAAVVAANELLGRPAPLEILVECAMEGERVGCGAAHPDNVGPALYGGFVLARSAAPPDLIRLPVPDGLAVAVLHPTFEIDTREARALLGPTVPLSDAVRQWANLGGLVAGLFLSDLGLIQRSLVDVIVEPRRAHLVPGFYQVQKAARDAGALGCSLSGSGPSTFALCENEARAGTVGAAMRDAHRQATERDADLWISQVGRQGARLVTGFTAPGGR